jgi:hypothetical protein
VTDKDLKPIQLGTPSEDAGGLNWRRILAGIGTFLLFADLFVSAGSKGSLGRLPLYVSILAIVLLGVAAVAGILHSRASKKK